MGTRECLGLGGGTWGHGAGVRAVFFCRPLHLAIIHEQTAVIKQLIEVVVSIPSQQIINITNNLQQVLGSWAALSHCHREGVWGGAFLSLAPVSGPGAAAAPW